MIEKSLVMIKPHAMSKRFQIIGDLRRGQGEGVKKIKDIYVARLPKKFVEEFYAPNYEKYPFFQEIMDREFVGKFAYFAIYQGDGIIRTNRQLIGPTNVLEAPDNTIRGKYGRQFLNEGTGKLVLSDGRVICKNVIHSTDESLGEFDREYNAVEKYLIK